jgi:type II secretory pathway pseudopilin PulG
MFNRIHFQHKRRTRKGMTLVEMTAVIMVMLALVAIFFMASKAWRRSSDRSTCIINIHSVQKAVRGFSNMYGYNPGETVPSLQDHLFGRDGFLSKLPICPAGGTCVCGESSGADVIPPVGELYLSCSLGDSEKHHPDPATAW